MKNNMQGIDMDEQAISDCIALENFMAQILSPLIAGSDLLPPNQPAMRFRPARSLRCAGPFYSLQMSFKATGSEVVADPYRVAFESLALVGLNIGWGDEEYDQDNPFGIE